VSVNYRSDGAVGFFRGVVPNALKVAPGAAITFVVYEECMKAFKATPSADESLAVTTIPEAE
jgi:hypothetical protein